MEKEKDKKTDQKNNEIEEDNIKKKEIVFVTIMV